MSARPSGLQSLDWTSRFTMKDGGTMNRTCLAECPLKKICIEGSSSDLIELRTLLA